MARAENMEVHIFQIIPDWSGSTTVHKFDIKLFAVKAVHNMHGTGRFGLHIYTCLKNTTQTYNKKKKIVDCKLDAGMNTENLVDGDTKMTFCQRSTYPEVQYPYSGGSNLQQRCRW